MRGQKERYAVRKGGVTVFNFKQFVKGMHQQKCIATVAEKNCKEVKHLLN